MDYGAIIYKNTSKKNLQLLDVVQNTAFPVITGAHRTSPAISIEIIIGEPPLSIRRQILESKYIAKAETNYNYQNH